MMKDKQMINQEHDVNKNIETSHSIHWLTPNVDIYEVDDNLVVQADLPGVTEAGLDIQVSRRVLTLEAVIEAGADQRSQGFYRQFQLSDRIDADAGDAALKDGVLTLRLPKSEEAKPRRIAVQTLH